MTTRIHSVLLAWSVSAFIAGLSNTALAQYVPGEPPRHSDAEPPDNTVLGGYIDVTEGSALDGYTVAVLGSAGGAVVNLTLSYSSAKAFENAKYAANTSLAFGWAHSYGTFLFRQQGLIFRRDGAGRITKFTRVPRTSAPIQYKPTAGYYETLVGKADGTFVITYKDGTTENFRTFAASPYFYKSPLYQMTERVDRNGNTTTLEYDENGRLETITDPYGRQIAFTYNDYDKIETITDPLNRVTRLDYAGLGAKLVKITDPLGNTVQYTYDSQYRVSKKVGKNNDTYLYSNLAFQRRTSEVLDAKNVHTPLAFLVNSNSWATDPGALSTNLMKAYVPSVVTNRDSRGNNWVHAYDRNGYQTSITAPDGTVRGFAYDPVSLKVSAETNRSGAVTRYEYDSKGNRTKVTDAMGYETTFTYDATFSQLTSVRDANGRTTAYLLDAKGNRVHETDPLLKVRKWTYDSHGNVLTAKDKRSYTTSYTYDAYGNLTQSTDPLGCTTKYVYDIVGNLLSRTDANVRTTSYTYDALDRLVSVTDPLGGVTQYAYDALGNRTQVTDCNVVITTFEYNFCRRLLKTTDAQGGIITQTFDGNGNRTSVTDQNGRQTSFAYDVQNRLTTTTDPLGGSTVLTYDPEGNIISETDANTYTTVFEYDVLDRQVKQTDARGGITLAQYAVPGDPASGAPTLGSNLVSKSTDANLKVTYSKYDALDRRTQLVRKEGDTLDAIDGSDAVISTTFDANGNLLAVTEPNGLLTRYEYDALNRNTKITNGADDVTDMTYDCVGNLATVTAPNGNVTANTYDANNRLVQVDDSVGRVAVYTYDCGGRRLTAPNGNGNGPTYEYDELYRVVRVLDAMGRPTVNEYDPVGNLIKVTDRNGHATDYAYDALNRRVSVTDALGHVTAFAYDPVGNLILLTDANIHATAFAYDELDRLIQETYADPVPNTRTYTYDGVGNRLTRTDQKGNVTAYHYNDLYFLLDRDYPTDPDDVFTYDLSGRMLTADKGGWLVSFAYDGANRVIQSTQNGQVIDYAYDVLGRTRSLIYPGGRLIVEQMDARSRLEAIDDLNSPPPIAAYTYDLGNRVVSRTYRNGTVASHTYNANDWTLSLEHTLGLARVAGFGYGYDLEGNKLCEEKRHNPGDSEAYEYDATDRLASFKVGALSACAVPAPATESAWNLDPVGNWNSRTTDGLTQARTHNEANEITAIDGLPVLHDDNGNLIDDGIWLYDYDEENRLIEVRRRSEAAILGKYFYDALGRRVVKRAKPTPPGPLTETRFYFDDQRVIEDQDGTAATVATYVYGNGLDEILTMDRGGGAKYYHQNALGSVTAVTDGAGVAAERYSYDAYGFVTVSDAVWTPVAPYDATRPRSAIGNRYLFTGRELDEESGLYYYRARHYDPRHGRFLQRDLIGYAAGDVNLYAYVQNNPIGGTDPAGLIMDGGEGPGDGGGGGNSNWLPPASQWWPWPPPSPPQPPPPQPPPPPPLLEPIAVLGGVSQDPWFIKRYIELTKTLGDSRPDLQELKDATGREWRWGPNNQLIPKGAPAAPAAGIGVGGLAGAAGIGVAVGVGAGLVINHFFAHQIDAFLFGQSHAIGYQ